MRIVAPSNSVVEVLSIKVGDVLAPNQKAATLLLPQHLWVRVYVPEPWLSHIKVGEGVIGLVLRIATMFATAMSLVRERERGTLEQLMVSPLSRWGLMLGKLVPYLCISMLMAVGLIEIMRWVFNVPVVGNMNALLIATLLYVFALLSVGLLISTRAQNQIQALQMCLVFILPSVFFLGFIFPGETMPWIFYAIGSALPATYYIELQRALVLRGASLADFWVNIVVLAGMGVAVSSLCALRFRQKVA
jgi:ABC-type multidrug transport system permease subunit